MAIPIIEEIASKPCIRVQCDGRYYGTTGMGIVCHGVWFPLPAGCPHMWAKETTKPEQPTGELFRKLPKKG